MCQIHEYINQLEDNYNVNYENIETTLTEELVINTGSDHLNNLITKIINKKTSNYKKEIQLKITISKYLAKNINDNDNLELYYWIVQKWGGISNFKNNDNNNIKILNLCKSIRNDNGNIISLNFTDAISSLSKIASFIKPKKYAIYDSRVIFTLNWIKYRCNLENDKYFLFPDGRSNDLTNYNYRIFLTKKYNNKIPYYNNDNTFLEYCKLLSNLSKSLNYGDDIYKTEMLLFHISKNAIIKDIEDFLDTLNI